MLVRSWRIILLTIVACAPDPDRTADKTPGDTLASPVATDTAVPIPLLDLAAAEVLQLNTPWTGDYDDLGGDRRFIRALVPLSRTMYYIDRGVQKGIAFEALREFEAQLPPFANGVRPKIVIIPTRRDRMFAALAEGYGDIALGAFTVTAARSRQVDFSIPVATGVTNVVVTRASELPMTAEDDLAGREIYVRRTSGYYEDLVALNARLGVRGKPLVKIREVDEALEDEDVLQMVDAGILPATVTNVTVAKFWDQVYDSLTVHDSLLLRSDGELAWALRKHTPQLTRMVNDFVKTHRVGTLFGNVVLRRYLGSAERLKNPVAESERKKLNAMAAYFRTYAERFDLPWLLVAAQAYQESRFDQSRRSPRGAIGVMQVMPKTAADPHVDVANIEQLEPNIHAGVKYLRFLIDQYFADSTIDQLNKGLFGLAAYNAGPGRVRQLRAKARTAGLNPDLWFGNVEIVAARLIGRETVDYVSNIYKYYTAYRSVMAAEDTTRNSLTGY